MSTASRRADFFVLEAAEYVNDLNQMVSRREPPDAERLVRGARALRGAALMAGLGTFARASASLEGIARGVRDHALAWDPHARRGWQEGLTTLRTLVAHAATWDADDDRQALALAERLERISGGFSAPEAPAVAASVLTPGVRAFIARESVLIAGSLEEAARALAPVPPPAALTAVLERMRALRGLGASTDLTPLPELLDAMEVATRTLLADHPAPPDAAEVFAESAQALGAMARGIAEHGRVMPPHQMDAVARRLLRSYTDESDAVAIASLAPDGEQSLVHAGTPPAGANDAEPLPVELVSVGDHLMLAAESLARGDSPAARDLRLFVLHRTLSTMPPRSGTARFLLPLTTAIRSAVADGMAEQRPEAFLSFVRDCGRFLIDAGSQHDHDRLLTDRDAVLAGVMGQGTLSSGASARSDLDVVPIESLAPDGATADDDLIVSIADLAPDDTGDDVVDIGDLAPDDEIVPIESLAPDDAHGEPSRLEQAYRTRATLDRESSDEPPSIDALIGMAIVPVESLLYRGHAALERANELQTEVRAMLTSGAPYETLRPSLDELLDVISLVRDPA